MTVWDKIDVLYDIAIRKSNSSANWRLTIITALIAFLGVGLQVWISYKNEQSNKEFSSKQILLQNDFEKEEAKKRRAFEEKWEQKKIAADLIAKSRIDWIQRVRQDSSELIAALSNFSSTTYSIGFFMHQTNVQIYDNLVTQRIEELSNFQIIISEKKSKLLLYFPQEDSDGKNKEILDSISKTCKIVQHQKDSSIDFRNFDFSDIVNNSSQYIDESEKEISNLSKKISSYLKTEWDKSKRGE